MTPRECLMRGSEMPEECKDHRRKLYMCKRSQVRVIYCHLLKIVFQNSRHAGLQFTMRVVSIKILFSVMWKIGFFDDYNSKIDTLCSACFAWLVLFNHHLKITMK